MFHNLKCVEVRLEVFCVVTSSSDKTNPLFYFTIQLKREYKRFKINSNDSEINTTHKEICGSIGGERNTSKLTVLAEAWSVCISTKAARGQ